MPKSSNKVKKPPLFKIEVDTEGLGSYAPQMVFTGVLVLAVIIYVVGVVSRMAMLTGLALFIALFDVLGYVFFKRHSSGGVVDFDIDEEVEKFRVDLIDTFTGYEVEPDAEEIDKAVAAYRKRLEEDSTPLSDIDLGTMSKVLVDGFKKNRASKRNREQTGE